MARWWKVPLRGLIALSLQTVAAASSGPDPAGRAAWGPWPFTAAIAVGILTGLAGGLVGLAADDVFSWSGILLAGLLALWVRRRLVGASFDTGLDEAWAGVAGPAAAAIAANSLTVLALAPVSVFAAIELTLARAAAVGVLAAVLVYSKKPDAAAVRLIIALISWTFSVVIWKFLAGIARMLGDIFRDMALAAVGLEAPGWLDGLEELGFMVVLYGALIGATWMVAEAAFSELIRGEDADVLKGVARLLG